MPITKESQESGRKKDSDSEEEIDYDRYIDQMEAQAHVEAGLVSDDDDSD